MVNNPLASNKMKKITGSTWTAKPDFKGIIRRHNRDRIIRIILAAVIGFLVARLFF